MIERLRHAALAPRDAAGLAAFRVLFGLVCAYGAVRFLVNGWVDRFFVEPQFFFKYWGFAWVEAGGRGTMIAVFVALAVLGVCIAVGLFYRAATALFFVLFTYVELIDVTNYLNHYYLVSLIALLLAVLPLHATWSVDAWLFPSVRTATLPAWMTWALRTQVGIVYAGASLAKVGSDWLVHGEPLGIWMRARTDLPVIGALLDEPGIPLVLGWAGFLNDALAVPLLLVRRTRPWMYATLVLFHAFTRVFFNIGLFPLIMLTAATVFFDASWPRRWARTLAPLRRWGAAPVAAAPRGTSAMAPVAALLLVQVLLPFRTHLYGGNVLWHEQGMRFSWRVMLREKNGAVTYRVRVPGRARELVVSPRRYLTDYQEREMSGQPDLILQLAHRVRDDLVARGHGRVAVYADAWVSLNGRPAARLIDPSVDLSRVEDGLRRADWILPAPDGRPPTAPATLANLLAKAP